jgi:hypothetical protein
MNDLTQIFDGDLAERVFIIGSSGFLLLFAAGALFLSRHKARTRPNSFAKSFALFALIIGAAIVAMAGSVAVGKLSSRSAAADTGSMSIEEIHKSIDMHALPVQYVQDYM